MSLRNSERRFCFAGSKLPPHILLEKEEGYIQKNFQSPKGWWDFFTHYSKYNKALGYLPTEYNIAALAAYIRKGGRFDAMGHWGVQPSTFTMSTISADEAEIMAEFSKVIENFGDISDPIKWVRSKIVEGVTPQNYKFFKYAAAMQLYVKELTGKEPTNLWWVGRQKMKTLLADVSEGRLFGWLIQAFDYKREYIKNLISHYESISSKNFLDEYNIAIQKREERGSHSRKLTIKPRVRLMTKINGLYEFKALARRSGSWEYWKSHAELGEYINLGGYRKNIFLIEEKFLFNPVEGLSKSPKKLGNVLTTYFMGRYFAYNPKTFPIHGEGETLRDAIEAYRVNSINGGQINILSFNDIRATTGTVRRYCIKGTKAFLRSNMPFIWRLLEPYNHWDEVPKDIMKMEFHLTPEYLKKVLQ